VLFWLGEISYGIFAIHMLVLNAVFRALDVEFFTGRFVTVAGLTLGITIVAATASYHLFERRVMRFKNVRFFARMDRESRVTDRASVH
jgi:peptidoglycan/LPS O-acetylase OafA/YrhL